MSTLFMLFMLNEKKMIETKYKCKKTEIVNMFKRNKYK